MELTSNLKEKLYEDKNLTLELINKGKYIIEVWRGYTTNNDFMKYLDLIADVLKGTRAQGLLVDIREHKGLSLESQELAKEVVLKHARVHGKIKIATVTSENVFSKLSVENFNDAIDAIMLIENRYFSTVEDARGWLEYDT
jgi:hypothetical protein